MEEMISYHDDIVAKFGLKGNEGKRQLREIKLILAEFKDKKIPKFSEPPIEEMHLPKILSSPKNVGISRTPETPNIQKSFE